MSFSIQTCGKFVEAQSVSHRKSLGIKSRAVYSFRQMDSNLWISLFVHISYAGYSRAFTQGIFRQFIEVMSLFSPSYTYPTITTTRRIFIN